jgi:TonB family protein
MLELKPKTEIESAQNAATEKQPRRLQIALALLLIALAVVLIKDREFWFGSTESVEAEASEVESTPKAAPVSASAKSEPAAATRTAKNSSKTAVKSSVASPVAAQPETANSDAPIVATHRVVLPPLDVEVVAGDKHSTLHPGSNITKVEIPGASNPVSRFTASVASFTTNAADRERLGTGNIPDQSMEATYPLLAQNMKVQGSVVLQAIVGIDGAIEDLHVLSGPSILTSAAQQAVRQWRFKPYLQNGQPVETKARITVNFSIRITDNTANAS